ncbi:bicyclomycin resistance protein [Penicillium frequentans]|uniref:Bicyclomycin resistance protein n=1 Tax=Penicillium frequentans TaxID=3151616 RepID=A0AAD6CW17_9EURO|nr:bicyclomycin resistance protein [Penicillium glabrum]
MTNNLKDPEAITLDAENSPSPQILVKEKDEEIVPIAEQWDDPTAWPLWRKWSIVICVALMYMLANFGTIIIVPGVPLILSEFNVSGSLYQPLIVSIWELGEGVGSFLVGPLSERYGRKIVYHIGNAIFILCSVASALSVNVSMLVAFRFINGMAVTVLTLSPSIIGDLFLREERGRAMAVAISVPLIGPCVAPIVGGYVASALGWRWTIWLIAIAVGCVSLFSLLVFKETYQPKIQGKQSQGSQNSDAQEIVHNGPPQETKLQSFLRPVRLLFSSPVVLVTSLFTSLVYGFSYLILTTLAEIMQETYGFSSGSAGLTFLGRGLYGLTSDRYLEYRRRKTGDSIPEDRLPLMILGTALLPVGLFLYGWTAHFHVQWSVPLIGTGIVGFSMLLTKLPTDNYLVDAFAPQGTSASILSADATLKALFGAVFPLLGPSLYRNLGLGWGNSLLAFIGLAFLPLFIILWREGQELRRQGWGYLRIMMKRR